MIVTDWGVSLSGTSDLVASAVTTMSEEVSAVADGVVWAKQGALSAQMAAQPSKPDTVRRGGFCIN